MSKSSKPRPPKTSKKSKAPSIEKIVAAVNAAAREQVAAETAAADAAAKSAAKKASLKEARAAAAAAAKRAERAARELKIAKAAATTAAEDAKTAAKKAKKAAKAKKTAHQQVTELAERTRAARARLDALPPTERGLTELPVPGDSGAPRPEAPAPDSDPTDGSAESDVAETSEPRRSTAGPHVPVAESPAVPVAESPAVPVDESLAVELPSADLLTAHTSVEDASGLDSLVVETGPRTGILGEETANVLSSDEPGAGWTLAQLRLLARVRGVRGYSAMSKARLYDALGQPAPGAVD